MNASVPVKKHSDLIFLGVISLWWHVLGLGFLVLWLVRKRSKALFPLADSVEVQTLRTARALGQGSVLLLVLSVLGIIAMVSGHSKKSGRTPVRVEHRHAAISDREKHETP